MSDLQLREIWTDNSGLRANGRDLSWERQLSDLRNRGSHLICYNVTNYGAKTLLDGSQITYIRMHVKPT